VSLEFIGAGYTSAQCGGDDTAAGARVESDVQVIVVGCGHDLAHCGGDKAYANSVELVGAISGAADITEQADTVDASGQIATVGAADITEQADTVDASGQIATVGAADITEQADTVDASGQIATVGAADITEQADTVDASGQIAAVGAADITEQADTVDAAGSAPVEGVVAIVEQPDTVVGVSPGDGLDLDGLVVNFDNRVGELQGTPAELAADFATFYAQYSTGGLAPGVDVAAGGDVATLSDAFLSDNTAVTIDRIADGVATYWATVTTPGAPAHGGTEVLSVTWTTDPAAFKAAVTAQVTDQLTPPGGTFNFHTAIETVLKLSPITVRELVAGVPTDFVEFIE
jgi:hypothetical protein